MKNAEKDAEKACQLAASLPPKNPSHGGIVFKSVSHDEEVN